MKRMRTMRPSTTTRTLSRLLRLVTTEATTTGTTTGATTTASIHLTPPLISARHHSTGMPGMCHLDPLKPCVRCITTSSTNEMAAMAAAALEPRYTPVTRLPDACHHVVYKGPGEPLAFEGGLPMPQIQRPTDVIIKILKTTICGTDVHILSGNVSSCQPGTRLGHEGIGEIVEIGSAVEQRKIGDRVLINTTTQCGKCYNCRQRFHGHCVDGGWQLGNVIDGMQGTFARIPHADYSTQLIPESVWDTPIEDAIVMCSDILPTGLEVGLLDGAIQPGMTIAIVGMGPVGLASLITSGDFKPSQLFAIDINQHRLNTSVELTQKTRGLDSVPVHAIDNTEGRAVDHVLELTRGLGVDLVVEAIGTPTGWYICQDIVKAGGHIAMLGVHGQSATINLEKMWHRNFRFSAGLVHGYTIPSLVNKVLNEEIPAADLISHKVPMSEVQHAYDLFRSAARYSTLKVLLENDIC